MGNCVSVEGDPGNGQYPDFSDTSASQRSAQIDKQIQEDAKKLRKECKILLLGPFLVLPRALNELNTGAGSSESGKSTVVKQMRIIHQDGFSSEARLSYRAAIYSNLMESASAIVTAMKKLSMEPGEESNRVCGFCVFMTDKVSLLCLGGRRGYQCFRFRGGGAGSGVRLSSGIGGFDTTAVARPCRQEHDGST